MSANLIVLAGGKSSRMKKSLDSIDLNDQVKNIALHQHKTLIPIGSNDEPLMYYLLLNAKAAGYRRIYIVTSKENQAFKSFLARYSFVGMQIDLCIQHTPEGQKPMGTADAVFQCVSQFEELTKAYFTVCNADNLYGVEALKDMLKVREAPHALVAYNRAGLRFAGERIAKFALIVFNTQNHLEQIIEKPEEYQVSHCMRTQGELRVSMNIFSFYGPLIYDYLKDCPAHPVRKEKELPTMLMIAIKEHPDSVFCFKSEEHVPDLTSAMDIDQFFKT
ncbi:MAG: glucose-1-phosphate thymidylyltransferase [Flavobacteriaceae bacterium]|nr:glucose-1-phosphate thymidylyltransferase [Flavobacteriaceae bacterium]